MVQLSSPALQTLLHTMAKNFAITILASLNLLLFSFLGLHQDLLRLAFLPTFSLTLTDPTLHLEQRFIQNALTLQIPKIQVSAPLLMGREKKDIEELLSQGALSIGPYTPPPEKGRTLIFGHSSDYPWKENLYSTLFANLSKLSPGDSILITSGEHHYEYRVRETLISDRDLSTVLASPVAQNELVLSTCYPIGLFSKRLNVIASAL